MDFRILYNAVAFLGTAQNIAHAKVMSQRRNYEIHPNVRLSLDTTISVNGLYCNLVRGFGGTREFFCMSVDTITFEWVKYGNLKHSFDITRWLRNEAQIHRCLHKGRDVRRQKTIKNSAYALRYILLEFI